VAIEAILKRRPAVTALAVVVGASVILTDPIFQGLAISLMAGSLVSMIIAPVACRCFISWPTIGISADDRRAMFV
jgi:multidrug efflux pump subunit AcrB